MVLHSYTLIMLHIIYTETASVTKAYEAELLHAEAKTHTHTSLFGCCSFPRSLLPSPQLSPSLRHGSGNMSQPALQATHVQHVTACWCDFTATVLYSVCNHPAVTSEGRESSLVVDVCPFLSWNCVRIFQMGQTLVLPWNNGESDNM